jgi:hypothetical protein
VSVDSFIPTLWSARLLAHLDKALVFAQSQVVNRDYEGEIQARGDTVKIGQIGDITVFPYVKNTDITAPEDLDIDDQSLVITESDAFNFQVDDVDRVQTGLPLVDRAMERAAYAIRDATDQFVAETMAEDGTPVSSDASDEYEQLIDLGVALDEQNVPTSGRFVIVPSWFHGRLLTDDRFVGSGAAAADARLLNGQVGEAAGFAVLKSNNVPRSSSDYSVIAGHPIATSFADQISKTEAYRMEKRFSDAVKGLHLYGVKVTRPEALAVLTASRT